MWLFFNSVRHPIETGGFNCGNAAFKAVAVADFAHYFILFFYSSGSGGSFSKTVVFLFIQLVVLTLFWGRRTVGGDPAVVRTDRGTWKMWGLAW